MSYNEENIITNHNQLEKGKDYILQISIINTGFNGTYTYCGEYSSYQGYKFINSAYEVKIHELSKGGFVCMYVINLLTNNTYFQHTRCNIFEILTNEYILK
jgi:hypothetical protein